MQQSDKVYGQKEFLECELTEVDLANICGGVGGGSSSAPAQTGSSMPNLGNLSPSDIPTLPGTSTAPTSQAQPTGTSSSNGLDLSSLLSGVLGLAGGGGGGGLGGL